MALSQQITTPTCTYEQPLGLFINNEFVKGVDGRCFETINPHNEKPIAAVHEATEKDVDVAVAAARAAFNGAWKHVTPTNRGRMLIKLAELMEQHCDVLAAIEALDNGKAYSIAKIDVANSAACIRSTARSSTPTRNPSTTPATSPLGSAARSSLGTSPCSCSPGK
ncbi:aldehyde dehydrogenase [Histoplasma capsulatum]|uniref:Aldehyde dehydrogenase n=1 Tax=Ajellomyces capsulatus TaxID=5037 RepID=A0A8A1LW09_AJECA|nr:aldehyde dehydrogenase [Histoplasma capsulatum]